MKTVRWTLILAGVVLLVALTSWFLTSREDRHPRLRIGSKNFTEQIILSEILAQLIEHRTDIPVKRSFNLGGTFVCFQGLKSNELDLYPEYTGTGLTAILKQPALSDPDSVLRSVTSQFKTNWDLVWLEPFGFNNTYTLTLRAAQAKKLGITAISGLQTHSGSLQPGFNHEFLERPDGYRGLTEHYGFSFDKKPKEMDTGLMYRAIARKEVDLICGFATDGRIPAFNLVPLTDDKKFFPPYYAAPLVRQEVLTRYPQLRPVLAGLAGRITDTEMARMNYQADEKGVRPARLARAFLVAQGLIQKGKGE